VPNVKLRKKKGGNNNGPMATANNNNSAAADKGGEGRRLEVGGFLIVLGLLGNCTLITLSMVGSMPMFEPP